MFDIGANLTHPSLRPRYDELLKAAVECGITDLSITAAHPDDTQLALAMIEASESGINLSTTTGLHPHLAEAFTPEMLLQMQTYASYDQVAVIGETGLDYYRMLAEKKAQQRSFGAQLKLAVELGKPVFLHQRDAHQDFLAILSDYRAKLKNVVVHCFTDTHQALQKYLALDCMIGITGWICDPKRGASLREMVSAIPADRLMIETDSPYLLPPIATKSNFKSGLSVLQRKLAQASRRTNFPHNLPLVLAEIARCRGQEIDYLARVTTANARAFFGCVHDSFDLPDATVRQISG